MKYKMVCIDMDGTLLSKGKVSHENKKAIEEAHKKGVEIVVTTGRIYNNAAYFSHLLGVKSPVIAANGAIVREKNSDKVIHEGAIPNLDCLEIIEALNKYKISFQMYTDDTIYCSNEITKIATKVFMTKHVGYEALKINYHKVRKIDEWKKILEFEQGKIMKFIALSLNTKKISFIKENLMIMNNITICGAGFRSIEINYKGVSKGRAVKALGDYYGIGAHEIMCIGDNENDISMINYAGLGVAMGNAINEVKEISDYVTDSNVNNGVAKAIKKFVLNEEEL